MARTSRAEVRNIFDTSLKDAELDEFIGDANALVTNVLGGQGLSADTLTRIEKYVAAHLASIRDPLSVRVSVGDAKTDFESRARAVGVGTRGLSLTSYGQHALVLDTTGRLKATGKERGFVKARSPWGDESDD